MFCSIFLFFALTKNRRVSNVRLVGIGTIALGDRMRFGSTMLKFAHDFSVNPSDYFRLIGTYDPDKSDVDMNHDQLSDWHDNGPLTVATTTTTTRAPMPS